MMIFWISEYGYSSKWLKVTLQNVCDYYHIHLQWRCKVLHPVIPFFVGSGNWKLKETINFHWVPVLRS